MQVCLMQPHQRRLCLAQTIVRRTYSSEDNLSSSSRRACRPLMTLESICPPAKRRRLEHCTGALYHQNHDPIQPRDNIAYNTGWDVSLRGTFDTAVALEPGHTIVNEDTIVCFGMVSITQMVLNRLLKPLDKDSKHLWKVRSPTSACRTISCHAGVC
jgi:hypothetical protein